MMDYTYDSFTYDFLIFISALLLILMLIGFFINTVIPFLKAREYIKTEIRRTLGREHEYWKKELKRLYLRHLPFVGRFFR